MFEKLAADFSDCRSCEWEVVAADVGQDFAYLLAIERTTASVRGAMSVFTRSMSTCLEADCLSVRCMSSLAEDRGPSDGAAAALFAAGIAARTKGKVIWCLTRPDLFPALAQAGLQPDRVVFVEATRRKTCLLPWRRPFRSAGWRAM